LELGLYDGLDRLRFTPGHDAPRHAALPQSVRSQGSLRIGFERQGAGTIMRDSFQAGCLRARLPRRPEGGRPCAVLLNTAGGLADGDTITQDLRWGIGTCATVTTQAAEKIYRAMSQGCRNETRIEVMAGAEAEWLPQETILFDDARLERSAKIMLADDVSFLGLEAVVLGRRAMGERMTRGALRDRMRIYRCGRLVYADALEIRGDVDALMRRAAIGGASSAMAVIVHASQNAERLLEPVRSALSSACGQAAASCWNGLLAVRMLAPDGAMLRADIASALSALRSGRPLPRVWNC
jgi:urease accessory protein